MITPGSGSGEAVAVCGRPMTGGEKVMFMIYLFNGKDASILERPRKIVYAETHKLSINARKARPLCEIRFFSDSSMQAKGLPVSSGMNTGS